jgi:hypothetical protein
MFFAILTFSFGTIVLGRKALLQGRLQLAAEAAALSSARMRAQMLNIPSHNLALVPIPWVRYGEFALIPQPAVKVVRVLAAEAGLSAKAGRWMPSYVGRLVARLNAPDASVRCGADSAKTYLEMQDMELFVAGWPPHIEEVDHVYFYRTWATDSRKAQPPHTASWGVGLRGQYATAGARVYLDVEEAEWTQNGGFPRSPSNEDLVNKIVPIHSLFPQFNAKLLPKSKFPWQIMVPVTL